MTPKPVRCAIYTRKSIEHNLDLEFNSLHAQREACEAFIRSQHGEGWRIVDTAYDDGGLSGGTLERPALRQLLADIADDSAREAQGRRPILIFCGDYVDRGPDSAKVLAALAWLRRRSDFEVHLLKGNHEQALLDFGGAMGAKSGQVDNAIYDAVRSRYSETELVVLVGFAGQMIATNVFNNVFEVEIDSYLAPYVSMNSK